MHTSIHSGSTGIARHPPRSGFTASFALSPGTIGGVDPVDPLVPRLAARLGSARFHQNLDADHGAPEPRDFSVRDTAARLARRNHSRAWLALQSPAHTTASRPPHPAPRLVTIGRNAPLHRDGMARSKHKLPKNGSEIFCARGLDRNSRRSPDGQISRCRSTVERAGERGGGHASYSAAAGLAHPSSRERQRVVGRVAPRKRKRARSRVGGAPAKKLYYVAYRPPPDPPVASRPAGHPPRASLRTAEGGEEPQSTIGPRSNSSVMTFDVVRGPADVQHRTANTPSPLLRLRQHLPHLACQRLAGVGLG